MFTCFLSVFLLPSLSGQQKKKIDYYDLDIIKGLFFQPNTVGPYSGTALEKYPNGKKKVEFPIKDGKINGVYKEWGKNGQKTSEISYEMGVKVGVEKQWYASGVQKLEVSYLNGVPHGVCTEWHKKGHKMSEGYFDNGKEEGDHYWWYLGGKKDQLIEYKNGKANGRVVNWYENGQVKMESVYNDGKLNGELLEWYPEGQKKSAGSYKQGKPYGENVYFAKSGRVTGKRVYENGVLVKEYDYGSGSIKSSNGYYEIHNSLGSNFLLHVKGLDSENYVDASKDITYTVDGMMLKIFITPLFKLGLDENSGPKENLSAYRDFVQKHIESDANSTVEINSSFGKNANNLDYLSWDFISPDSKATEQKARTAQHEYYISLICKDKVLSLHTVHTNSDEKKKVEKMINNALETVQVIMEPINILDYRK